MEIMLLMVFVILSDVAAIQCRSNCMSMPAYVAGWWTGRSVGAGLDWGDPEIRRFPSGFTIKLENYIVALPGLLFLGLL
jgi:hypothetical protein